MNCSFEVLTAFEATPTEEMNTSPPSGNFTLPRDDCVVGETASSSSSQRMNKRSAPSFTRQCWDKRYADSSTAMGLEQAGFEEEGVVEHEECVVYDWLIHYDEMKEWILEWVGRYDYVVGGAHAK